MSELSCVQRTCNALMRAANNRCCPQQLWGLKETHPCLTGGPDRRRAGGPGGPQLSKFVGVLRELRDAGEMLHTQTEVALCERLQPWAEVAPPSSSMWHALTICTKNP